MHVVERRCRVCILCARWTSTEQWQAIYHWGDTRRLINNNAPYPSRWLLLVQRIIAVLPALMHTQRLQLWTIVISSLRYRVYYIWVGVIHVASYCTTADAAAVTFAMLYWWWLLYLASAPPHERFGVRMWGGQLLFWHSTNECLLSV